MRRKEQNPICLFSIFTLSAFSIWGMLHLKASHLEKPDALRYDTYFNFLFFDGYAEGEDVYLTYFFLLLLLIFIVACIESRVRDRRNDPPES